MLTELKGKSQVTIPGNIVSNLGLAEGTRLDIYEKDGAILMVPVAARSEKYFDEFTDEAEEVALFEAMETD